MNIAAVFNQLILLFIPVLVGYLLIKRKICEDAFVKNLSTFLFTVTLPCSIISAMQFDFDKSIFKESLMIVIASVVAVAVSFGVSLAFARAVGVNGAKKGVVLFSIVFSNFSFMGYPIAEAFMGEKGLFYATVFSLPLYFFVQSLGLSFISENGEKGFKLKYILNPPMVGVYVGFLLFLTRTRLSGVIDDAVSSFASMTTPLAMLLVGMSLTNVSFKNVFGDITFYAVALLRLIVLPLISYYLLFFIGFDLVSRQVTATITMMPVAANIIITLIRHGKDSTDAAKAVFITCLLSFFTIPLMWMMIF